MCFFLLNSTIARYICLYSYYISKLYSALSRGIIEIPTMILKNLFGTNVTHLGHFIKKTAIQYAQIANFAAGSERAHGTLEFASAAVRK